MKNYEKPTATLVDFSLRETIANGGVDVSYWSKEFLSTRRAAP